MIIISFRKIEIKYTATTIQTTFSCLQGIFDKVLFISTDAKNRCFDIKPKHF